MLKKILYVIGAGGVAVGLWGALLRLTSGHQHAAYGSFIVWGLWVAMYLFLVGTAAGAFMLASLDHLFNVPLFKGTGTLALWGALVALGAGLATIWVDLGHMERIWRVYAQPNWLSVMAQMVWGYSIFGLIALVALRLVRRAAASRALKLLMVVGLVCSVFLSGGVGALIGVEAARPYWHVGLFPAQFPIFSLASGAAFLLMLIGFFGDPADARRAQQLWVLSLMTIVLQVVKLYFLWADFSQSLYGGIPMNVQAVNEVMFGAYWWAFWVLQIGAGTLLPLVVLAQPRLAKDGHWAGAMGLCVLAGFAVARANVIFPALAVPEFEALRSVAVSSRLSFAYFPSAMEWAVAIGIVGAATLAFLLGLERFVQSKPTMRGASV